MSRLAFVTGGASGLGAAVCRALAASGHRVAVVDLNAERARAVQAALPGSGHLALTCDVTDKAAVTAAIAEAEKAAPIAVMALFAGGTLNTRTHRPGIGDMTDAEWDKTIALNTTSVFYCVREFFRLRKAKPVPHARLVLVASQAAYTGGVAGGAAYAAGKAALLGLTRGITREAAAVGATVNCIAPGPFETPAFETTNDASQTDAMLRAIPLGRIGAPDEMGSVVAFLASEGSGYITGQILNVNGGSHFA